VRECPRRILSLAKVAVQRQTQRRPGVGLSRSKVAAGLAISDMDRATEFHEAKLSLSVGIGSGNNVLGLVDRTGWLVAMIGGYLDAPIPETERAAGGRA
jgi:hypothetical protein